MYTSRYHYRLQNILTQLQYPKSKILNNFIYNVTSVLSIINKIDCSDVKKNYSQKLLELDNFCKVLF